LRRFLVLLAVGGVVLGGGCGLLVRFQLLPERFAVNAPLRQLLLGRGVSAPEASAFGSRIRAAPGFQVGLFAEELPNARFLSFTETGDLLVSQPRSGRILLLERDSDGDGRSDAVHTLLEGLERPHGLDVVDGWLYVGETDAVGRVGFDAPTRATRGAYERVVTGLPSGGNHWTRTLRFGPDGALYVSVGSSCNVCVEEDPRRAAILRYQPDGSGEEIFASGLRNAVGFDWQPATNQLYATDNGRDLLGDDFPPCELNRVVEGGFYGWPLANGDRIPDPDLGAGRETEIAASHPPAHAFGAHNAPLGMAFLRGEKLPASHREAALVALHGSWNRSRKDGYKVVSLHFGPDGQIEERDFVWGFLEDDDVIGRPVDVAEGPDGDIYISDDYAGAIYRVVFGEEARPTATPTRAIRNVDPWAGLSPEEREQRGARGSLLYESHACAACHDPDRAEAGVVVRPLAGLTERYDPASLAAFLKTPTPPMPVAPLTDAERQDLAVHLLLVHP
jgi:glucose/arabinose dehydrogenase/cytochrome c553